MTDIGAKRLAAAIIIQTAEDYYVSIREKDKFAREELDQFIESAWFATLCDNAISPDQFRESIRLCIKSGQNLKKWIEKWSKNLDALIESEEAGREDT